MDDEAATVATRRVPLVAKDGDTSSRVSSRKHSVLLQLGWRVGYGV